LFPASQAGRVNQGNATIGAHKCFGTAELRLARFQRREKAIAELALRFSTAVVWQPRRQISSDNSWVTVPIGTKGVGNLWSSSPFRLNCCCQVGRGHKRASGYSVYERVCKPAPRPSLSLALLLAHSPSLSPWLSYKYIYLPLPISQYHSLWIVVLCVLSWVCAIVCVCVCVGVCEWECLCVVLR